MKNELCILFSADGSRASWTLPGTDLCETTNGDFWRIIADDGYHMEMTIHSCDQHGNVVCDGNVTTLTYDQLVTDDGTMLDASLVITVTQSESGYAFASTLCNRSDARLNELQCPYVDFNRMAGERSQDVLYRPRGLGERIVNPWAALESAHSEYKSADYNEIKSSLMYPRPATMTWMGIQSQDYFFYIGKHDERTHACCLLSAIGPRHKPEPRLISAICQYPFVNKGETLTLSPVHVSMYKGDWREASDLYGSFARSTYFQPVQPRQWVQNMTGWQRIIMRHQYGEIFFKYADLPRLYLEGKEYGLDTLLVFGWWKGRFDNGYPKYEVDEELGGEEGLRTAIDEIQRLGGRVILYNNGILIDKNTDFYRQYHDQVAKHDIAGNEYLMNYRFEKDSTYMINYGYISFVEACQATDLWADKLEENGHLKLSFGPDGIFYDQVGGISRLCFNDQHKHGKRVDDELHFRRQNLARLRAILGPEQALGTECTNDAVSGCVDYLHGCDFANHYHRTKGDNVSTHFPQMFRRTFPEIIMTNRYLHDERTGWKDDLNYTFIQGFRFDVAIFRSRKVGIAAMPDYAKHVKKLLSLKQEYARFFYSREARYVCQTDLTLPAGVFYTEYICGDERMFALRTELEESITLDVLGKTVTLEPRGVACVVVNK
ncbi:MAG: hypothetical protein IJ354_00150 [Clostridia bacterium]|nr:hypothetical protein [Clostridia bacterium]